MVWFPDGPGGDHFEEKCFKGPLGRMTRDALEHIERQFLKETVLKRPDRAEASRSWNYPFAAIEEAVVNAVYHRSYEIREPVEVRITPEELVVLSFPGPDRSIRMEDLRAGRAVSRRYRNRRIGEFLKELDLAEGRATGIPKILRVMAANGSPLPEFQTDDERSSFLIRLPIHEGATLPGTDLAADQDAAQDNSNLFNATGGATPQVPPQVPPPVPPQVERLVEVVDGAMGKIEIREALGLKDPKHYDAEYLRPALRAGVIEMTQPDKPRSSRQRYRLTPEGLRLKGELERLKGDE